MGERSAGAVVFRKEGGKVKYLLLLYGAGHWDYVKGHIEPSETDEETVVREAEEEAGIMDLKLVPGFREVINYFYTKDGKKMAKEVVFLLAETHTEKVKLSFEHKDHKWLEYASALKQVTFPTSKDVLRKADKYIKSKLAQK